MRLIQSHGAASAAKNGAKEASDGGNAKNSEAFTAPLIPKRPWETSGFSSVRMARGARVAPRGDVFITTDYTDQAGLTRIVRTNSQLRHPEPCEGSKCGTLRTFPLGSFARLRMTGSRRKVFIRAIRPHP